MVHHSFLLYVAFNGFSVDLGWYSHSPRSSLRVSHSGGWTIDAGGASNLTSASRVRMRLKTTQRGHACPDQPYLQGTGLEVCSSG
jgi:hypothetical protein